METPESIAAEGTPDPDKPTLKSGGRQILKRGGMSAANADFDRLACSRIEARANGVRIGWLTDGRIVVVRPISEPTLEVQEDKRPIFKIRYGL